MAFTPFPTPTFIFGQTTASTTSCGRILLDPQGEIAYIPAPKKGLLIISSIDLPWDFVCLNVVASQLKVSTQSFTNRVVARLS